MQQISLNEKEFVTLKRKYEKAVKEGKETFIYKGEFLTSYAKYLIEYLEPKFYAKRKNES